MALELPTDLVECISRIKVVNGHRITKERVWLYVLSSPEYFNSIVADNIALVRARYGFSPAEHSDWVFPTLCYSGGSIGESLLLRPLNSWVLKNPVSLVPSFEEITEQYEWWEASLRVSQDKTELLPTKEELHDLHVTRVCGEFYDHVKLLAYWREANGPREQQECYTGMTRKELKTVVQSQRQTMLLAKTDSENYDRACAPEFICQGAQAKQAMETAIYHQLHEVLRFC